MARPKVAVESHIATVTSVQCMCVAQGATLIVLTLCTPAVFIIVRVRFLCYAVGRGTRLPPPDCGVDVLMAGLSGTDCRRLVFGTPEASNSELHKKHVTSV